mmetsp:Transcript_13724/g.27084  ORF Transcript_13724/g.27084 Transcript_13724/m.27084 type:complete len:114 (+) Transcript_13724:891-1232(+)
MLEEAELFINRRPKAKIGGHMLEAFRSLTQQPCMMRCLMPSTECDIDFKIQARRAQSKQCSLSQIFAVPGTCHNLVLQMRCLHFELQLADDLGKPTMQRRSQQDLAGIFTPCR